MLPSSGASTPGIQKILLNQVTSILVLLFQAGVVICFITIPILAFRWMQQPFIGAFVEHTLVLNTAKPSQPDAWMSRPRNNHPESTNPMGLPAGYQVTAIAGREVRNARQFGQALSRYQPGDTVALTLRAPDGVVRIFPVRLLSLPLADRISYFVIPYITGLVYLACSLYVFSLRRRDPTGRAFALFTASSAITLAGLFDTFTTHQLTYLWTLAVVMTGGALFNLALVFPLEFRHVTRYPVLRWLGYVPAGLLALLTFPTLYDLTRPAAYFLLWRAEFVFTALSGAVFLVWTAARLATAPSPIAREQARLILIGALVSFVPVLAWFLMISNRPALFFSPLFLLAFFPLATGYAILRYRLLNSDYLLNRGVLYLLLSAIASIGYALLVSGLSLVFGGTLRPTHPLLVGLMVFILAMLLNPLRTRLQQSVDAVFFRGQAVYRSRLQTFGRELTQAIELQSITGLLWQHAMASLLPARMHIFVHDTFSDFYVAIPDENGRPTTDLRFPSTSALVQTLGRRRDSIFLGESNTIPLPLLAEQARLALLGVQLFIPMPGQQQLIGWLALGPRRSGEPYTSRDLSFLESLCDQAALAVERAQVVADLERRVREMNVLTRVAQGTNVTVAFDDILELLFAQTNQVIPTRDFRVTLYNKDTGTLYHAFYLEDDDRLYDRENTPLPGGWGLEVEIIRSQRSILTDDYERECRSRGVQPITPTVTAWMGVPLNTGADTIGALCLGSRVPAVMYTEEQRNLLQAIADQAAGAIVKARLLQESEHRARQLATLNEIGRSLTSTLELKPLLNQILKSATEILNCAAGSLFLVDPQTQELVFEVVTGPVAENLLGRRLPRGTGLVGEAVETSRPLIANNAKRRKEWFDQTDQQTGFDTQDLLVVPMKVKDQVIGVIEVINKGDGSPFDQNDQEMLSAFSSQATIAIENARLYTLTDQALADRVEELSVMQQIDRELNASLDAERAMRITLDWAMRQSSADAGLVGIAGESGVRVMVLQGYPSEQSPFQLSRDGRGELELQNGQALEGISGYLPAGLSGLHQAVQTGLPQFLQSDSASGVYLLAGACRQWVVPIRREGGVIGILLLESRQAEVVVDELMDFLSRLADHAAVAIANAQLYSEVQSANLAKSKFVSFVAHELKNPMASIKGYTELIAGGMAGPVNDMQSSFLATIRSNVDRMNTIVSDLNDLTKIQVGSLRLDFKAISIREVVEDVLRSLRRQFEEKELSVSVNLLDNLPMVWADQLRLGQILTNLLSNAQKYTPKQGVVTVGAESCFPGGDAPGALAVVHIWVQDTGIGIRPEDQDKVFQQYFRTEISKEMASGTGLGLNITRSLVEMQGGEIWFESVPDRGTTFHFTIPVAETS